MPRTPTVPRDQEKDTGDVEQRLLWLGRDGRRKDPTFEPLACNGRLRKPGAKFSSRITPIANTATPQMIKASGAE